MIVRNRKSVLVVNGGNWKSERLLLKKDGMGFSFHITTVKAGTETKMHYQNHLEAVYCIKGEGVVLDLENNQQYEIVPGTLYALNNHDQHVLKAKTEMEFACVFNPPCTGNEQHDESGAYPINKEE